VKVRKLRLLSKKAVIGNIERTERLLEWLELNALHPLGFMPEFCEFFAHGEIGDVLSCFKISGFFLIKKMVLHEPTRAAMPEKYLFLRTDRIKFCSVATGYRHGHDDTKIYVFCQ